MKINPTVLGLVALGFTGLVMAHGTARPAQSAQHAIEFPDTAEYRTLVLDLHTHSVFSDGHVWPTVRINEAVNDHLDGIAITEHLEFQPHLADIPHPDRNRSYEEALRAARNLDLKVIPGVEITRQGDPGHINAVFVKDANPLVKQRTEQAVSTDHMFDTREAAEEFAAEGSERFRGAHQMEHEGETVWMPYEDHELYLALTNYQYAATFDPRQVLEAANEQGAFLFWNHPNFDSVDSELNKFHRSAVKDGLLHGVEIANGNRYYQNAHRLALKHNLALIGVSDVHELIAWDYDHDAGPQAGHRPVTLVFAENDSIDSMREALFDRRTVVWWKNTLIGRPQHLGPLLDASIAVESIDVEPWGIRVKINNASDARFVLANESDLHLSVHAQLVELAPHSVTEVTYSMDEPSDEVELEFSVMNAFVAPNMPAKLTLAK